MSTARSAASFSCLPAGRSCVKAATLRATGELTETLRIIYYPFTYAVAVGCVVLALVLVTDFLQLAGPGKEVKK